MSMRKLDEKLKRLFRWEGDEDELVEALDEIIDKFGVGQVKAWRNLSNGTKNTLLHEFVEGNQREAVRHLIEKYEFRTFFTRESDNKTPLEVAEKQRNWPMRDLIIELGGENRPRKENHLNIVWMDLEFTSFDDPQILECAVIITDRNLQVIERKQWIVQFDQESLDQLSDWHQKTYGDVQRGGNGLFGEVLKSRLRKEEMEEDLLRVLRKHCPEKKCPLAGSSIHSDKDVLKRQMPSVNAFLHHHIIDVTSFEEMLRRWAPSTDTHFKRKLGSTQVDSVRHRAMRDIEWSIEVMKLFRPLLTSRSFLKECSQRSSRVRSMDRCEVRVDEVDDVLSGVKLDDDSSVDQLDLNDDEQTFYEANPHLREVFLNHEQLLVSTQPFSAIHRQLTHRVEHPAGSTRTKRTVDDWPERRILLNDLEFLTECSSHEGSDVIYLGNPSLSQMTYLTQLFPHFTFHLFDQRSSSTEQTDRLRLSKEKFNEQIAARFCESPREVLLIVDLCRLTSNDKELADSMKELRRTTSLLHPERVLVRFTLPQSWQRFEFFAGDFLCNLWSSTHSMDLQLVVDKDARWIDYNAEDLRRLWNDFQNWTRTMFYENDFDHIESEGIDHCYDCRAELFIVQSYLVRIRQINDRHLLDRQMAQFSAEISQEISDEPSSASSAHSHRTLQNRAKS